jgi:uncharacterized protein (TIGR02145 family)
LSISFLSARVYAQVVLPAYQGTHYQKATNCGTITDYDGNVYQTVIIGDQCWMKENLKTTKYKDGTSIPYVPNSSNWIHLSTPGYCWFNNDQTSFKDTYGALYNWHAVNTGNLCPNGWHVSSDAEFTELTDYIASNGHSGTEATALKSTSGWNDSGNGTDNFGFSALPGGYRHYNTGDFWYAGDYGDWWCATGYDATTAWMRSINSLDNGVLRSPYHKSLGFSVRCIKD